MAEWQSDGGRKPAGLNAKEIAFAEAYARNPVATDAHRLVYKSKGTNQTVARSASRILHRPKVQAYIEALRAAATGHAIHAEPKVMADLARTLLEGARIAFFDPRGMFVEGTTDIKPPSEWTDEQAAVVAGIEVRDLFGEGKDGKGVIGTVTKLKFHSKVAAVDMLMKHHGAYEKDNRQKAKALLDGLPREVVKAIQERIGELARPALAGTVTARSTESVTGGS